MNLFNKSFTYAILGFTGGIFCAGFSFDSKYQEEKAKNADLQVKLQDAQSALNHVQEQYATYQVKQNEIDRKKDDLIHDLKQANTDIAQDRSNLQLKYVDLQKENIDLKAKLVLAAVPSTGEVKTESPAETTVADAEPQKTFDATINRPVVDDGQKQLQDARKALQHSYDVKEKWDNARQHPPGTSRPKESGAQYIADLENRVKDLEFKYGN